MSPTTLGLIAGSLTSIASIPQLVKTLKTRHARDISIWQPILLSIGVALWMFYGKLINDMPLMLANIVPLICNVMLTILKVRYRNDTVTHNSHQT
jgi:MtN3 and saliva related transmembrane protein